jgi:hypothetical protein
VRASTIAGPGLFASADMASGVVVSLYGYSTSNAPPLRSVPRCSRHGWIKYGTVRGRREGSIMSTPRQRADARHELGPATVQTGHGEN